MSKLDSSEYQTPGLVNGIFYIQKKCIKLRTVFLGMIERKNNNFHFEPVQHLKMSTLEVGNKYFSKVVKRIDDL